MSRQAYDVIVVGAGPAGSVAARRFAERGLDVLLIEKRQEIGTPVRCAEALGIETTRPFLPIEDRWITARISTYTLYSKDGACVRVPPTEPTLVVDRRLFDWELARLAAQAGAEVRTHTAAVGVILDAGHVVGVQTSCRGNTSELRARLVIAADGTESQVARWSGLKTVSASKDYYVGYQYLLGNLCGRLSPTNCEYHLENSLFPGGYGWVFPKGDDVANVGLVISADRGADPSAQARLDTFVARRYPGASILGVVAGGIPITGALKHMVTHGLMVVGDAAHQADTLTGGGINLGMIGAEMAAEVGADALSRDDVSAAALHPYELRWHEKFGAQHEALYRIRKMVNQLSDQQIDSLLRDAAQILSQDVKNNKDLLFALFRSHPQMLIQVATLAATQLILK